MDGRVTGITLIFPRPGDPDGDQKIPASFLLRYPALEEQFAYALIESCASQSPATRSEFVKCLPRGFYAFLDEAVPAKRRGMFGLSSLTTPVVNQFVTWLERVDPKSGKAVWAPKTRKQHLAPLTRFVEVLRRSRFASDLDPTLHMPRGLWPGAHRQQKPTRIIQRQEFERMYRACVAEVTSAVRAFADGQRLIAANRWRLPVDGTARGAYSDIGTCLSVIDDRFPGVVPTDAGLARVDPALARAVEEIHGSAMVLRRFHPTARDLVPFVLLLTVHYDYNPETILTCEQEDFPRVTVLGRERIGGRALKRRSGRRQMRSHAVTDDIDNSATLLEFVKIWTERLRRVAEPHIATRLFLFTLARGSRAPQAFASRQKSNGDARWIAALNSFCKDYNLRRFTLKQVRHTVHDHAHELFEGDLRMVAAIGGQRSAQVINDHYMSDAARERNLERLSGAQALMLRDRSMRHRADARRERDDGGDPGAATPGWICLDPYSSPMHGEVQGRLCQAYGRCPICPHAQLDTTSPVACARAHDLLARVDEALAAVISEAWLARWAQVRRRLVDYWLPRFPESVLSEARTLDMRRLPPLE
ncbi:hypothetical protein [Roseicella aerolata]|uniref:Uncharacterized protein n=1 Tax=Roseicella aerolata TaxID=2883479 RepID=A0A9X1IHH2_9PROT|nr:hypothetical protein [Roseicella aerolata]MCB4824266.1 hypothetical protein [Roseicella aerolata]